MPFRPVVTQTVDISEARETLLELVQRVAQHETRVIVEEAGSAVAAIISADDLRCLMEYDIGRARDLAVLDASQGAFGNTPEEELEARIAQAIEEVRAEGREQGRQQPTSE